jgi:hypothetical protein
VNVISRQQIAYNTYMYVNTIASMLEISKKNCCYGNHGNKCKKSRLWHTIKSLTITQFETNKAKTIPAVLLTLLEKKNSYKK